MDLIITRTDDQTSGDFRTFHLFGNMSVGRHYSLTCQPHRKFTLYAELCLANSSWKETRRKTVSHSYTLSSLTTKLGSFSWGTITQHEKLPVQ
jgi:hypothetical protein